MLLDCQFVLQLAVCVSPLIFNRNLNVEFYEVKEVKCNSSSSNANYVILIMCFLIFVKIGCEDEKRSEEGQSFNNSQVNSTHCKTEGKKVSYFIFSLFLFHCKMWFFPVLQQFPGQLPPYSGRYICHPFLNDFEFISQQQHSFTSLGGVYSTNSFIDQVYTVPLKILLWSIQWSLLPRKCFQDCTVTLSQSSIESGPMTH